MQIFQERVSEGDCAVAREIGRFKTRIESVIVRWIQRGVQLGDQPLFDAIEPLIFSALRELDIAEHALLGIGQEGIITLDIRVVFVPLGN